MARIRKLVSMSNPVKDFLAAQMAEIVAFRHALSAESDRGCVLFAAAYLEEALKDLLCCSLVKNKHIENDLFDGTAPLATFSAKIKFAYYLGKISAVSRRDLDTIRAIRNNFAHSPKVISFTEQSIADRCKNLEFSYHDADATPRERFTAAVFGILADVHRETFRAVAATELPDNRPSDADKEAHRQTIKAINSALTASETPDQGSGDA